MDFWEWLTYSYSPQTLWVVWSGLLVSYACWLALEYVIPAERNQPVVGKLRNAGITVVYLTLASIAGAAISFPAKAFALQLGGPLVDLDGIFRKVPAAFLAVWTIDFFYYWFHRLQHTWGPLWAFHRLHHSDEALNVTTTLRHHPLEEPLRAVLMVFPMALLVKITPIEAGLIGAAMMQWGKFIHANVRIPLGPVTPFISGPQYHRVHHSIEPEHVNKNYAAFLPLWDWIFGTYVKPTSWPKTGITPSLQHHSPAAATAPASIGLKT